MSESIEKLVDYLESKTMDELVKDYDSFTDDEDIEQSTHFLPPFCVYIYVDILQLLSIYILTYISSDGIYSTDQAGGLD